MADSGTRLLSAGPSPAASMGARGYPVVEPGLADVVALQRRNDAAVGDGDEQSFFLDTIAEYQWARDAAGLASATLEGLTKPVLEVRQHYNLSPWPVAADPAACR